LQELMREQEEAVAAALLFRGAELVLVDGPLRLGTDSTSPSPLVGVIKRFARRYLDPEQEELLGRLGPGERTPLFGLMDQEAELRGYSWYTRIAPVRPPWHDHAGIVRCEVRAGVRLDGAMALADRVTGLLPSRSEEHTSELQSHLNLVCRLLLEKKKKIMYQETMVV